MDGHTQLSRHVAARVEQLSRMLEARSVALVGASVRHGSVGREMVRQLLDGGFPGAAHLVNPRYETVAGRPCHASLEDVPEAVDLAVLAVASERVEEQLRSASRLGVPAAVVFASGHEEVVGDPPLLERLRTLARASGLTLCGPNSMGFVNFERHLRAVSFYEPLSRRPGPVALVSQSGSVFSALLHNQRELEFNVAVSSGAEITTTAADYLHYALGLDSTRVVALFLETVRDPERFTAALVEAAERDVPVVALKVGRSGESRALVEAHAGALATDDGTLEGVFDAHGVSRVGSLDELCDTVELFAAGRRARRGGLATVHDSGGERAHLTDVARDLEVPLATLSEPTRVRLAEVLDPGLVAENPLDAWGTGNDYEASYGTCVDLLHADAAVGAVALVVDLTPEAEPSMTYVTLAREAHARTTKPFAVVANFRSALDRGDAARLRRSGVPVLEGTTTALAAFRHLLAYRDFRDRAAPAPPAPPGREVRSRWLARLARGEALAEHEALALLADYGIPVAAHARASSAAEALAAAARIGWPVALKTAGAAHKSDVDGVRLGIADEAGLRRAYGELAGRLGTDVVVARMVPPGVELALGVVRDPQFGPVLVVGAGGVLVEVLDDKALALPPVDEAGARRLLGRLRVRRLLAGVRGAPPADLGAAARAIAALGVLASDLGDAFEALDVNPLVAGPGGCWAVDALVLPRRGAQGR